eukprot:GHVT01020847.1.p3 GENE.GHVT01020847.1~~GHVT01020847.1.p3  ORF type:complete len:100 (+),score=9.09 GHVT01020847.1:845-1144(+)
MNDSRIEEAKGQAAKLLPVLRSIFLDGSDSLTIRNWSLDPGKAWVVAKEQPGSHIYAAGLAFRFLEADRPDWENCFLTYLATPVDADCIASFVAAFQLL